MRTLHLVDDSLKQDSLTQDKLNPTDEAPAGTTPVDTPTKPVKGPGVTRKRKHGRSDLQRPTAPRIEHQRRVMGWRGGAR